MIKGIDVSHWQGDINWYSVQSGGYDFALIKGTQGIDIIDSKFSANVDGCKEIEMPWVPYHFYDPAYEALRQYDFFMEIVTPYNPEIGYSMDLEWQRGLSAQALTTATIDFLGEDDYYWLLYSNLNYLNNKLLDPQAIMELADIWLAWPSIKAIVPTYPKHYPKEKVKIWQRSWWGNSELDPNYPVPGIDGDVDINLFMGTEIEFLNWVKQKEEIIFKCSVSRDVDKIIINLT